MGVEKRPTARQVVKQLLSEDGWKAFYRGLGPRFFSMSAWGTSMILAYEYLSMILFLLTVNSISVMLIHVPMIIACQSLTLSGESFLIPKIDSVYFYREGVFKRRLGITKEQVRDFSFHLFAEILSNVADI